MITVIEILNWTHVKILPFQEEDHGHCERFCRQPPLGYHRC
jgi:hypothetical protein